MDAGEFRSHLTDDIIPFWRSLRDNENGGYYGYMDFDHGIDTKAVKGCILNSRITWFFANAYMLLKDESLLDEAAHGFSFLKDHCMDKKNGGVFWSVTCDGLPAETLKHTYNQAFSIYALSSYYDASKDREALDMAYQLYELIEGSMRDEAGYKEAFDEEFHEIDNDKLSENGVMAQRTMNTLLHVFEAYTELYRVDGDSGVKDRIMEMMDTVAEKIYNPAKHRQEVFFDADWNSIIDLHSYGHDIETSWLVDRGVEIIGEKKYKEKMTVITMDLARQVYESAFDGHSMSNECERGKTDHKKVWWVQAETVVGFLNAAEKCGENTPEGKKYRKAAEAEWEYIKKNVIDSHTGYGAGREWYALLEEDGTAVMGKPIVEPWKCPYHNGRMCMEAIRRIEK